MIFDVLPSQIQALDSKELVELLRKLLHAEGRKSGISLRGVSVPLQITISDGGEDARIAWKGGQENTDYLPARFSIFQSKATDPNVAGWKKEVWSKTTQKKGAVRKLNNAMAKTIAERGSYVGFTNAVLVGNKYDDRIQAIKDGILEAHSDPSQLAAIDIYDANKIAEWVSSHPSVGIWLNELQSGLALGGFQTMDGWSKRADFVSIERVTDKASRYTIGGKSLVGQEEDQPSGENKLTFEQAKERIADHIAEPRTTVRLFGPSGIGKSRFILEVFSDRSTFVKSANGIAAIYCDFRNGESQIIAAANTFVNLGSPAVLIVDECPREAAAQLHEIVTSAESQLRLVTIDIDDRPITANGCLNISISPGDEDLMEGIIRQRLPKAKDDEILYIKDLCGGFPRIAVLATESYVGQTAFLKSIDDVVERILKGSGITDKNQIRSIESLALFDRLGADGEFSETFDLVAASLAGITGDKMYEHIASAAQHQLVDRRGRVFKVQPAPIAAYLGYRRLDVLRVTTLVKFIENAPSELLLPFLEQWKFFDRSNTAIAVAEHLLARDELLGTRVTLESEFGSKCLNALVHVAPDAVAKTMQREFGALTVDELIKVTDGRRHLVWALTKLVFRRESFAAAAHLLMRLAAAENESWSNNATGYFGQLFQLRLCGTVASPAERFSVLDQGLTSPDNRIVAVCVEALKNTLKRGHFSRSGGAEKIGTQLPLRDWQPTTWGEIFDFHRAGLKRLTALRRSHAALRESCEKAIATHIRALLSENLYDDVVAAIDEVVADKGLWLEAIKGVGDWLYFDRADAPLEFAEKVRAVYDRLIPKDLMQRALLYTKFWSTDIRNPDLVYNRKGATSRDFDFSSRKAREVATEIAADDDLTQMVIRVMVKEELHNAFPFAHELGLKIKNSITTFRFAVSAFEGTGETKGIRFIHGLLAGIDRSDNDTADACLRIALESPSLKAMATQLYAALDMTPERLNEVVAAVENGSVQPDDCVPLSYGRRLDDLSPEAILPLLDALCIKYGTAGIWAALEILSMYQHDRSDLNPLLEAFIKEQLVSPTLLEAAERINRDGYLFETLTSLVDKHAGLNNEFALGLSEQATRICKAEDHDIFFAMDDSIRKVLSLLVVRKPLPTWQVISRFYEVATSLERHRLENLMGPDRYAFDGKEPNGSGVLFGVPETELLTWSRDDPASRAPFLCTFYPLLAEIDGNWHWHSSFERLAAEFGQVREFRSSIARRLHPTSWSGSLVPQLEIFLGPLEKWFAHSLPELALWARETHQALLEQIKYERRRDTEDT